MFASYSQIYSSALLGFGSCRISLGSAVKHLCNPLGPDVAEGPIPLCQVATGSLQKDDTVEREPSRSCVPQKTEREDESVCSGFF